MQIKCENLSIGYNGNALYNDINIEIKSGEYICIVGENGAGKTTLMKTILNLLEPISGKVFIGDKENTKDIGYLPQQTQVQKDFPASVYEVVLSGCLNKTGMRPFYNKKEKQIANNMIKKLGIEDLTKKSYSKLSGGQQQRTLLARALCATDKILLLDEPTSGLDKASTAEFYKIIKQLNNEGTTIIMITHNLSDVLEDASVIISLINNKVQALNKNDYKEINNAWNN